LEIAVVNLLHGLLQGIALTAIVSLSLKVIPRLNAATRYAVWWVTIAALVILAIRPAFLEAPFKNSESLLPGDPVSDSVTANLTIKSNRQTSGEIRVSSSPKTSFSLTAVTGASIPWLPIHLASEPLTTIIVAIWVLASTALLVRLAIGWRSLQRIKSGASPASTDSQSRCNLLARQANSRRNIRLLISAEVTTPMALGLFAPAIVIPHSLMDSISDATLDHIVLHELAHLHRFDDWTNLFQNLIASLFPIQPALFWVGRQLKLELETACDDHVIAATRNPKRYAASLTRIAELTFWARSGVLAHGAGGNPSHLYRRIHRLLDKRRNAVPRIAAFPVVLAIAGIALWIRGSALTPQLIAFAEPAPAIDRTTALAVVESTVPERQARIFNVQAGDELVGNIDFGNVRVGTWDQKQVRIVVVQKGSNLSEVLKRHEITMTQDERVVHLSAKSNAALSPASLSVEANYQITVPRKFNLQLKNGTGNTAVIGVDGKVTVTTETGNVKIINVDGTVDAHTGTGSIAAMNCKGTFAATIGPRENEAKLLTDASAEAIAG
jgi:beta-lactamase regulating signal transducer with metallopeptidase domain